MASVTADQTVSTEGSGQSVAGTAVDVAGNSASFTVTGINIDKTAPTISGAPTTTANGAGWWKTDVTVHFTASDGGSGLASVTADQTVSTEGSGQSVTGTAIDNAGNSASFTISGINIDKTAPTTTCSISGNQRTDGWYNGSVQLTLTTESTSGVAATTYSFDKVSWYVYSAPFTVSAEGTTTVYYNSTDKAGNVEIVKSTEVNIAYSVTFTMNGLPSGTLWSLTFGTTTLSSTSNNITFQVKPGSYVWNVSTTMSGSDGNQYLASPRFGIQDIPDKTSQWITCEIQTTIAPLWWVLGAIIAVALITSTVFLMRRRRKNKI